MQDGEIKGIYTSKVKALEDMKKRSFTPGSFLIILCGRGEDEYMRRYRSRADFIGLVAQ